MSELTVHYESYYHCNNPPDGSNWELLCLYCHDNEHSRNSVAEWYEGMTPGEEKTPSSTYKPFADLSILLEKKSERDEGAP